MCNTYIKVEAQNLSSDCFALPHLQSLSFQLVKKNFNFLHLLQLLIIKCTIHHYLKSNQPYLTYMIFYRESQNTHKMGKIACAVVVLGMVLLTVQTVLGMVTTAALKNSSRRSHSCSSYNNGGLSNSSSCNSGELSSGISRNNGGLSSSSSRNNGSHSSSSSCNNGGRSSGGLSSAAAATPAASPQQQQ